MCIPLNVPVFDSSVPTGTDHHTHQWITHTTQPQLNWLHSILMTFELADLAPVWGCPESDHVTSTAHHIPLQVQNYVKFLQFVGEKA